MEYKILSVGQLAVNCYLVWCDKSRQAVIIDPGDDFDYIFSQITDLDLKPIKILATHGHFDHILAVSELKLAYDIPFFLHQKDKTILPRSRRMCQYFCQFDPGPPPNPDGFIKQGDSVVFGNESLKVLETPGHTYGGVCFYSKKDRLLFCGDTIFANGGLGRTDLKEGDYDLLVKSIKSKIFVQPENTILLPGHGELSTIGKEKNNLCF